jgi:hypothetical protein
MKKPDKIGGFAVHPFANEYPLMEEIDPQAFERFVQDIKRNGLRERIDVIELQDGDNDADDTDIMVIIEGRDRALALECLGIKIDPDQHFRLQFELTSDEEIRAYITSKNLHRRHLTKEWQDKIIALVIKSNPEKSSRVIAEELASKGIETSHMKVHRERQKEARVTGVTRDTVTERDANNRRPSRSAPSHRTGKRLPRRSVSTSRT